MGSVVSEKKTDFAKEFNLWMWYNFDYMDRIHYDSEVKTEVQRRTEDERGGGSALGPDHGVKWIAPN